MEKCHFSWQLVYFWAWYISKACPCILEVRGKSKKKKSLKKKAPVIFLYFSCTLAFLWFRKRSVRFFRWGKLDVLIYESSLWWLNWVVKNPDWSYLKHNAAKPQSSLTSPVHEDVLREAAVCWRRVSDGKQKPKHHSFVPGWFVACWFSQDFCSLDPFLPTWQQCHSVLVTNWQPVSRCFQV